MGYYETVIIYRPDLPEEELERRVQDSRERLEGGGAQITDFEHWGKKRLTYKIRKERYGHYVLFRYHAPPDLLREVEGQLRINEQVLKFLTVRAKPGQATPPDLLKGERGRGEEGDSTGPRPESAEGAAAGTRRRDEGPEERPEEREEEKAEQGPEA